MNFTTYLPLEISSRDSDSDKIEKQWICCFLIKAINFHTFVNAMDT